MNVKEAISTRKATRAMLPTPISDMALKELVDIAGKAPSWANSQPWEIYVVTGEKLAVLKTRWQKEFSQGIPPARPDVSSPSHKDWEKVARCKENMMQWKEHRLKKMAISIEQHDKYIMDLMLNFYNAPVCIYLGLHQSLGAYSFYDIGAYSQTLMLAAMEQGLQSMPAFSLVYFGDILHEELNVPDDISLFMGICLGYADDSHIMNEPNSERIHSEQFMHYYG